MEKIFQNMNVKIINRLRNLYNRLELRKITETLITKIQCKIYEQEIYRLSSSNEHFACKTYTFNILLLSKII